MSAVLTRSYLTNLYARTFYLFICSGHLNIGVYIFISAQRILFRFMFLFLCNHLRFLWGFCLIHVLIKWKKILLLFFFDEHRLKKNKTKKKHKKTQDNQWALWRKKHKRTRFLRQKMQRLKKKIRWKEREEIHCWVYE